MVLWNLPKFRLGNYRYILLWTAITKRTYYSCSTNLCLTVILAVHLLTFHKFLPVAISYTHAICLNYSLLLFGQVSWNLEIFYTFYLFFCLIVQLLNAKGLRRYECLTPRTLPWFVLTLIPIEVRVIIFLLCCTPRYFLSEIKNKCKLLTLFGFCLINFLYSN